MFLFVYIEQGSNRWKAVAKRRQLKKQGKAPVINNNDFSDDDEDDDEGELIQSKSTRRTVRSRGKSPARARGKSKSPARRRR